MRNTVLIPALLALSVGLAACSHQPNVNLENAKTNFSALQTNPEATKVIYDVMDGSETLEAKMMAGGSGYDLIFPGDTVAGVFAAAVELG